jgi:hypothetical protein
MYNIGSQYQTHTNESVEILTPARKGFFTAIIDRLSALLTRSETERSRARYRARRAHEGMDGRGQDIVRSLPIEEKLRLGMYPFMD